MALYNGNEFNGLKGTKFESLRFIWSMIYTKFIDFTAQIAAALANFYTKSETDTLLGNKADKVTTYTKTEVDSAIVAEATARANADQELQTSIAAMRVITAWDTTTAFPTLRSDGQPFKATNLVQITVASTIGGVEYKVGDMLICKADVTGNATITNFGDVDSGFQVPEATASLFGKVILLANKAAYDVTGNDTAVISKVVLKEILTAVVGDLTTAYSQADTALQAAITTAYNQAIATALANYYTKTETDALLGNKTDKTKFAAFVNLINASLVPALGALGAAIPSLRNLVLTAAHKLTGTEFYNYSSYLQYAGQPSEILSAADQRGYVLKMATANLAGISTWAGIGAVSNSGFGTDKAEYDLVYDVASNRIAFNANVYTDAEATQVQIIAVLKNASANVGTQFAEIGGLQTALSTFVSGL